MASIYKRKQDRGKKRCPWYIGYTNHTGKRRTVKGFTDRGESERLAVRLEDDARLIRQGLKEPVQERLCQARREPIERHVELFEKHLQSRDVTPKQVDETVARLRKLVADQHLQTLADLDATVVETFLANLRGRGRSKQTANHYLKAVKQFAGWLVRTKRLVESPLSPIRRFNVQTDRRHDRRPLSADELFWLVHAAETGPDIESIPGPDRAVMYVLAAWTGLRKGEIGSLTPQSFDFDSEPPTVTVMAMFSKRKRHDTQVLHPCVAERLRAWLIRRRGSAANILLFPVSGKVPGGVERKTHKMMERDLAAGRLKWLDTMKDDNALSDEERGERERSDFLKYRDSQGRFADFHSNRHTFITNLGRAGVSPKTAQELARHSDIRLTIGIYSHSDLAEKVDAVRRLPSPTWLNGNGTTAVPEEPRVSLPENGSAQRLGSAPKSQASTNGHLASEGVQDKTTSAEPKGSAEVVVPSAVAARRRKQSPTDSNIPGKIRTCNLRLRSAMMACG